MTQIVSRNAKSGIQVSREDKWMIFYTEDSEYLQILIMNFLKNNSAYSKNMSRALTFCFGNREEAGCVTKASIWEDTHLSYMF